ncbi:MAG: hypothetical protein HY791_20985 [Deltaproteobacteria bacterium]|nr:hypothetical protein [Deltaproteobacteria bacterium]
MPRRASPTLSVWLLFACEPVAVVSIPLPPEEATSVVIATRQRSEARLWAFDVPTAELLVTADGEAPMDVAIMFYEQSLAELGIGTGELGVDPRGGSVPRGEILSVGQTARPGGLGGWVAQPPPDWLLALRSTSIAEIEDPCTEFEIEVSYELPGIIMLSSAVAGEGGSLLVAGSTGPEDPTKLFRVSAEAAFQLEVPMLAGPRVELTPEIDGISFARDASDRLFRGGFAAGFEELPRVESSDYYLAAITASPDGDELFVLLGGEALYGWSSTRQVFEQIHQFPEGADWLWWLGPDEFIVARWDGTETYHLKDAEMTTEATNARSFDGWAETELGMVLVSSTHIDTEFFVRSTGRWAPLLEPQPIDSVRAITRFGDGFLFGTRHGIVGQYTHERLCESRAVAPGFVITHFVPTTAGTWMVGAPALEGAPRAFLLRAG